MNIYIYPSIERKDPNKSHHKLAPVEEGRWKLKMTDERTVLIENSDRSVENVSLWRVVLVQKTKAKEEMEEIVELTKVRDNETDWPTKEDITLNDIVNGDDEVETDESNH